jgi:hypothetical protein
MLSVLCHYHLGHVDETERKFKLLRENRSDMQINDKIYRMMNYFSAICVKDYKSNIAPE